MNGDKVHAAVAYLANRPEPLQDEKGIAFVTLALELTEEEVAVLRKILSGSWMIAPAPLGVAFLG